MPPELLAGIIAEALPLGLNGVKLTGGEPLLHPDVHAILNLLAKAELELILETNGILLTGEIAARIAALPSSFVSISLDGAISKTHDQLRGKNGAYAGAIAAIRKLTDRSVPTQIIMSLMQDNLEQIEQMITLAADLGVSSLKFNLVQPIGRGSTLHDHDRTIPIVDLIALARRIEIELAPASSVSLYFDCPPAFKSLSHYGPDKPGNQVCGIFSVIGVLADGSYALCGIGSRIKELTFGRAGKVSLQEVWQHQPILKEIRSGLPSQLKGICGRCLMQHLCLGSCLAMNYFRSGSLWAPFWFCEQAESLGLFPAGRYRHE